MVRSRKGDVIMKLIWEPMVVAAMLIESMPEAQSSRNDADAHNTDSVREDPGAQAPAS